VIWGIAIATIVISVGMWVTNWNAPLGQRSDWNLMLWAGRAPTESDAFQQLLFNQGEIVPLGQFHWWQLITHAFLHGGILHLAGNMLFLLVLGSRVNALIGPLKTAILYPLLAVAAGLTYMIAEANRPLAPMVGASGAIMGLAGMYLVLFPVHRVHMVAWVRLGLMTGFRLSHNIFAIRGFWVVLFYLAFDVLATLLGSRDNVAHWAHLGGFIAGVTVALALLIARQIDARGADLISVVFGRYAWAVMGKPSQRMR
jgi:membrane associated rhomboid family serine protease